MTGSERKKAGILHGIYCKIPPVIDLKLPLGRDTDYPQKYAPEQLCPVARSETRAPLGLGDSLPFSGVDLWTAWDLTWLDGGGVPRIATAGISVPADSPNLVESKSLKLYLGSFAMTQFASPGAVRDAISKDLSDCAGAQVEVVLDPDAAVGTLGGNCIDGTSIESPPGDVDASVLHSDATDVVEENLHTHLLRSLCPVTGQPDIGSLQITYEGPRIDGGSLLRYVLSYRNHQGFHEACVEQMFVDILARCAPAELAVYARYQRRGGIDINPFRSTSAGRPENTRLWRQ
jgi:7-cyano-7-deazaguanine reductase